MFHIGVDGVDMTAQPDRSLFCMFGESGHQRTIEVVSEVCISLPLLVALTHHLVQKERPYAISFENPGTRVR